MVVGKKKLRASVVIVDRMVHVKVVYRQVAIVLQPVECEEQGQIMTYRIGMCQKANNTVSRYHMSL